MNRSLVLLPLLFGSLLLSACIVQPGDACEGGGYTCSSQTEALECRDKKWRTLPCRGPQGCSEDGQTVSCDLTLNVEGDACAASAEGRGQCTADATAVLECRMGTLVKVKSCSVCTMDSTRVICQP
ncbi:MAG TPA: hypothetical protein VF794_18705 [Archangium sp.]|jgi:hypothetical protein|uniref:hypothetical protein n=1 Tax=Archangium sp. TaxID=1872627 RepID=UPI002ED80996